MTSEVKLGTHETPPYEKTTTRNQSELSFCGFCPQSDHVSNGSICKKDRLAFYS